MTDRQRKYLLYAAGCVCILLAIVQWGIIPAQNYRQELKEKQNNVQQRLQEIHNLGRELKLAKAKAGGNTARGSKPQGFTLFSFLEQQSTQDQVKNSVEYMRPISEQRGGQAREKVQMRLDPIRLAPLMAFLNHVEQAPEGISIQRITIRSPRSDPGKLRVDVVFATSG